MTIICKVGNAHSTSDYFESVDALNTGVGDRKQRLVSASLTVT